MIGARGISALYDFLSEIKLSHFDYNFNLLSHEIREKGRKLVEAGEGVSEGYLVSTLLRALDPARKYKTVKAIVESLPKPITYSKARNMVKQLISEKKNLVPVDGKTISHSARLPDDQISNKDRRRNDDQRNDYQRRRDRRRRNRDKFNKNKKNGNNKKRRVIPYHDVDCFNCGKHGHFARDCPDRDEANYKTHTGRKPVMPRPSRDSGGEGSESSKKISIEATGSGRKVREVSMVEEASSSSGKMKEYRLEYSIAHE